MRLLWFLTKNIWGHNTIFLFVEGRVGLLPYSGPTFQNAFPMAGVYIVEWKVAKTFAGAVRLQNSDCRIQAKRP